MAEDFPAPEITEGPERKIVALARDFTMQTRGDIPKLWGELWSRPFEVENRVPGAAYGATFGLGKGGKFRYGVGFQADPPGKMPDGACVITLAGGTHAVFRKRAPIASLPDLFDHIFNTWLPGSQYRAAEGAVFERYPDTPDATGDKRVYEIWVPVRPR